MSSRPAMFFGRISFSLYLVHYIPLKMSLWARQTIFSELGLPGRVACLIAILLVCVGLAVLTHRYLEVRFQNYARNLLRAKHGHPATRPTHMKTA
jgi:peptidoglycan/LPS O-acetylase OafA/YrhL